MGKRGSLSMHCVMSLLNSCIELISAVSMSPPPPPSFRKPLPPMLSSPAAGWEVCWEEKGSTLKEVSKEMLPSTIEDCSGQIMACSDSSFTTCMVSSLLRENSSVAAFLEGTSTTKESSSLMHDWLLEEPLKRLELMKEGSCEVSWLSNDTVVGKGCG